MRYTEELVEEVRSRNDIVEVISGYVRLQPKSRTYWGLCPFHNERTPSFHVQPDRQMFHCFGCGAGGDVFTFIMQYENASFQEAVKMLAERVGMSLPEEDEDRADSQKESHRKRLLAVNREAAGFFYYQLRTPVGAAGYEYLSGRALTKETMQRFGLGYAGENGREVVQYLKNKGFGDELLIEAGIARYTERFGLSCPFWNRVMYPIQDLGGRVIGFGGRVMGPGEPKYLNSQETPVFDKRKNLYGLNYARRARSGNLILCEGYMDVIAMHQAGFTQAVASLGTAFTAEQATLLHRFTDTVLLAYDSDEAGVKAALRAIGILREAGMSGRVISLEPYKDPDEFIKARGKEAFQERIDQAQNSFFFELGVLEKQYDMRDPEGRTRFHREIADKLADINESVERDNYLVATAEKYHIGVENLRSLVRDTAIRKGMARPAPRPASGVQSKKSSGAGENGSGKAQRLLLSWMVETPSVYDKIRAYVGPEDFFGEVCHKVAEGLFGQLQRGVCNPAALVSGFEELSQQQEASALLTEKLPETGSRGELEKALKDVVLAVKRESCERNASAMNGADMEALKKVVEGRKALEAISKAHISLD